jgi:hypothetical protein
MFRPYGAIYMPPRRNEPVKLPEANPLPLNAMSNDTGNAAADGYSVYSRADRWTGERPMVGGDGEPTCPRMEEDY